MIYPVITLNGCAPFFVRREVKLSFQVVNEQFLGRTELSNGSKQRETYIAEPDDGWNNRAERVRGSPPPRQSGQG